MKKLERYLSGLTVTQGRHAGQPFKVLPWERRFIRGAFADGVGTAALSVARGKWKNGARRRDRCGRTGWTLGRTAWRDGDCGVVTFAQACIAFEHVVAFMDDKLKDRKRWRVWQTGQLAQIEDRETGAKVRCLGSDPRRAHGLAPSLLLLDEPAQWPPSTGEKMLSALSTSLGKQPGARLIALGTRPASAEHWFSKMLAGTADYAQCHAAGADDPPFNKRTWARANPSLAYMPDLMATITREAGHARTDPSLFPSFTALRLNGGTSDTEESVLLEAGTWAGIEGETDRAGRCVWGADLGTSAAMSAVAAYWPDTGRLECVAAFPFEPSLAERGLRDGVGSLYVQTHTRGELIQTGGRAVDLGGLLREALERFGRPARIVADRWREAETAGRAR